LQLRDYRLFSCSPDLSQENVSAHFSALKLTADFILQSNDTLSEASQYFRSLRKYYQQAIHDKCVVGLLAMMLCLEGSQHPVR